MSTLPSFLHPTIADQARGDLRSGVGDPTEVGNDAADPKEAVMLIGQVEETGVIEPLLFPRAVPADEPVTPTTGSDEPVPEPAAPM